MGQSREYLNEETGSYIKIFMYDDKSKYKMLNGALGIIIKTGKLKSSVKITNIDGTDLYRPKTNNITKEQLKKSADKTFLGNTFQIENKYIQKLKR